MTRSSVARAAWISFAAWFGVLYWLSSGPIEELPASGIPHIDKAYHAGYFFIGGLLLAFALSRTFHLSRPALVVIGVIIVAAIGCFDEWHQSFSPGRSGGDLGDLFADTIGGAIAFLLLAYTNHGKSIGLSERKAAG